MTDDLFLSYHYTDKEISTLEDRVRDGGVDLLQFTNMLKDDVSDMWGFLKWNDWSIYVRTRGFVLADKIFKHE